MTNKIALRTIEEFMSDYTPVYQPVYPLLLGRARAYPVEVGKMEFRRVQTIGDIRGAHLTPKDTEMKQIQVNEFKKVFKRYFLANQYILSQLQDGQGTEEVIARVLDEHQKQMDELVMYGEGTSNSTMLNNGLYYSADPNYTTLGSSELPTSGRLAAFHQQVVTDCIQADRLAGRKLILFFGGGIVSLTKGIYAEAARPFISVLEEVVSRNGYSLAEVPQDVFPGSDLGYLIINIDQILLHYTAVPQLMDQGVNSEKMYAWFNFLMGSTMVEVLTKDAIIRKPLTLAT